MKWVLAAWLALPLPLAAQATIPSEAPQSYAVRAGSLIDPLTESVASNQTIVVVDGVITAIGAAGDIEVPPGTPVVDLSDRVVLPGLMDAHVHLTSRVPQGMSPPMTVVNTPMARRTIIGVRQAREVLLAGFTTVRDIGNSGNYVDTELRRAVDTGVIWGPSIVTSGKIITPFGGQMALNPERPELGEIEFIFADTPEQMIRAVRENVHFGAQVIKIVVDDQPYLYSADDIRVIVDEAARSGRQVAAHVLTDQGARNAIEGGARSLEHAWGMTDNTLALAREAGVTLVTTDFTTSAMEAYGWSESDIQARRALVVDRLRRALQADVTVAFGSDLIWASEEQDRGAWAIEQIDSFLESGATPGEILRMMTVNVANLLELEGKRGRLQVGYAADLIAVASNPLEDIAALKTVSFVMADGRIARWESPR